MMVKIRYSLDITQFEVASVSLTVNDFVDNGNAVGTLVTITGPASSSQFVETATTIKIKVIAGENFPEITITN